MLSLTQATAGRFRGFVMEIDVAEGSTWLMMIGRDEAGRLVRRRLSPPPANWQALEPVVLYQLFEKFGAVVSLEATSLKRKALEERMADCARKLTNNQVLLREQIQTLQLMLEEVRGELAVAMQDLADLNAEIQALNAVISDPALPDARLG